MRKTWHQVCSQPCLSISVFRIWHPDERFCSLDIADLLWVTCDLRPAPYQSLPAGWRIQKGLRVCFMRGPSHRHRYSPPPCCFSLLFHFGNVTQEGGAGGLYLFQRGRVRHMCVCVKCACNHTGKFNKRAFLCSCYPKTRLKSVGNNENDMTHKNWNDCVPIKTLFSQLFYF